MKLLFIGDIVGEPGRRVIRRMLHKVVGQHDVELVIGNGENVAGGFGITPELTYELFDMGIAVITTGNHAWDKKEIVDFIKREPRLLRPANYPAGVPGRGSYVAETPGGERLGILQLMGRAYMPTLDCPFQVAGRELALTFGEGTVRQILPAIALINLGVRQVGHPLFGGFDHQLTALDPHGGPVTVGEDLDPGPSAAADIKHPSGPVHRVEPRADYS